MSKAKWKVVAVCLVAALQLTPSSASAKGETEDDLRTLNEQIRALHAKGAYADAIPLAQQAISVTLELHERSARSAMAYIVEQELRRAAEVATIEGIADAARAPALGSRTVILSPVVPLATDIERRAPEDLPSYSRKDFGCTGLQFATELAREDVGKRDKVSVASLTFWADCNFRNGELQRAESQFREVLTDAERAFGTRDLRSILAHHNLAMVLIARGDFAGAEALSKRACELSRAALSPDDPTQLTLVSGLVAAQLALNGYERAQSGLQWLAARASQVPRGMRSQAADWLTSLGQVQLARGDADAAARSLRAALEIREVLTRERVRAASDVHKLRTLRERFWSMQVMLNGAIAFPRSPLTGVALDALLQTKGRALDAVTANVASLRRLASNETLIARLTAVYQRRARLNRLTQLGHVQSMPRELFPSSSLSGLPPSRDMPVSPVDLFLLGNAEQAIEAEIAVKVRAGQSEPDAVTWDQVASHVPSDSALIEYFRYFRLHPEAAAGTRWGEARYGAFVLRPGRPPKVVDVCDAKELEELAGEFREHLKTPTDSLARASGKLLHERAIGPLEGDLVDTKRWIVSADGALHVVPFAALVDRNDGYLLDAVEIGYVTSGRDLLRMAAAGSRRSDMLILANPDFDKGPPIPPPPPRPQGLNAIVRRTPVQPIDERRAVFPPLKATAAEAERLGLLLKLRSEQILTGDRATVEALRAVRGPQVLHIATHGYASPIGGQTGNLLDWGLALTGANRWEPGLDSKGMRTAQETAWQVDALSPTNTGRATRSSDGMITAAELALLDLSGTELVVLSACETGLGNHQHLEGVFGTRRALVQAGAQAQVVSLWRVDDEASAELMVLYYRHLATGAGRAEALRLAQQDLIRSGQNLQHPYFWATFIPIGDWRSLSNAPGQSAPPYRAMVTPNAKRN